MLWFLAAGLRMGGGIPAPPVTVTRCYETMRDEPFVVFMRDEPFSVGMDSEDA